MKRKKIMGAAALSLCLALGLTIGSTADSRRVVTLGADLTEQQKQIVLNYFGVTEDEVDILTINNQDERDHLGAYVPLEQIGTRTFSCAYVSPTRSGGIQVKTANLDWVTCNMIATTLSTSGVVNCEVIAASPIKVSGTGALTGIIMAYEQASGEELEPQKKELATQELVITGQLADTVGQKEATAIVNEAKTEIISQNITDITVIQNIVNEAASENDAQLSQEELDMVTELLDKISQEDYNYDDMKDTLEMVEENVGVIEPELDIQGDNDGEKDAAAEAAAEAEAAAQEAAEAASEETEETEPSILNNTNDDAFGEDVIMGSTLEPETSAPETDGFADVSVETEVFGDMPVETEVFVDTPVETEAPAPVETEAPVPVETEAPASAETEAPVPDETEAPAPAETEAPVPEETEPEYTMEDLTEANSLIYKQTNWYLNKVFGLESEYSESQEYAEIQEMTVTTLDAMPEIGARIQKSFDDFFLKMLVEGLKEEDETLDEADTDEYGVPEVKVMYEELKKLLVTDEDQLLIAVEPTKRETICTEAMDFFKKLYGVEEETPEETDLPEEEGFSDVSAEEDLGEIPEATTDGTIEG